VQATFEITNQWFSAEQGAIKVPESGEETVGSHCVLIVGFDVLGRRFRFVNRWGEAWGQHGIGYLPIEYFEKYFVASWAQTGTGLFPDYLKLPGITDVMWRQPDFLGHSVYGGDTLWGCEVHNGITDEHMGWAFAVHREGHLDVEELFVRPQFRGQGIANRLVEMLLKTAAVVKLPLRMWIPFADWTESNIPAIETIASKLGLALFETDERWAAAVAMYPQRSTGQRGAAAKRIPPGSTDLGKKIPARPASICAVEEPPATSVSVKHFDANRYPLRGTPVTYRDPTAPVSESDWESLR
jgi:ribosomal protein S18 acetylase RimI-like enzyme